MIITIRSPICIYNPLHIRLPYLDEHKDHGTYLHHEIPHFLPSQVSPSSTYPPPAFACLNAVKMHNRT